MKIIECPRDAMQGIEEFIPTDKKVKYLNQLLKVGFDTLDFGSFVSHKAIPQMRDTSEVVKQLDLSESRTKLLAIVANSRGATEASEFEEITYLGFPLSISETFQVRNTNKSIVEALNTVEEIQRICLDRQKELVVYISMGFGNPYGDPYNPDVVLQFAGILNQLEIKILSLADTIGVSDVETISTLFTALSEGYPNIEFGAHLHSRPENTIDKIDAAFKSGCRRFDGAIKGYGGCPMAEDSLVGNIATEAIINYFTENRVEFDLDIDQFKEGVRIASQVFPA